MQETPVSLSPPSVVSPLDTLGPSRCEVNLQDVKIRFLLSPARNIPRTYREATKERQSPAADIAPPQNVRAYAITATMAKAMPRGRANNE
jgi:hypothetical protein